MYRTKIWDEDKWDIHFGGYNSSGHGNRFSNRKNDSKYHEQKYGAQEKNMSSDYIRNEEGKEDDKEKNASGFDDFEAETIQNELKEEELPFKAAKEIFKHSKHNTKQAQKKDANTIEDAIRKAIETEKKIIIVN